MLCARLLKEHKPGERGHEENGKWLQKVIDWYAVKLTWVLDHQRLTLLAATATVVLTGVLYVAIRRASSRRRTPASSRACPRPTNRCRMPRWPSGSRRSRRAILKDSEVASLSSFIGVDGSNVTLNSGRFLINLKPRESRTLTADQIIRRIAGEVADVPGIKLYMQPSQDLTLDDTVSRTRVPVPAAVGRRGAADELDAQAGGRARRPAAARRRGQRSAGRRSRGQRHHRPRQRGATGHQRPVRSTMRCTTPSASASSRRSSRSRTSIAWCSAPIRIPTRRWIHSARSTCRRPAAGRCRCRR